MIQRIVPNRIRSSVCNLTWNGDIGMFVTWMHFNRTQTVAIARNQGQKRTTTRKNKGRRIRNAWSRCQTSPKALLLRASTIKELSIEASYDHVPRWQWGWCFDLWNLLLSGRSWWDKWEKKMCLPSHSPPCLCSFQGWKDSCPLLPRRTPHCKMQSVTVIRWEGWWK